MFPSARNNALRDLHRAAFATTKSRPCFPPTNFSLCILRALLANHLIIPSSFWQSHPDTKLVRKDCFRDLHREAFHNGQLSDQRAFPFISACNDPFGTYILYQQWVRTAPQSKLALYISYECVYIYIYVYVYIIHISLHASLTTKGCRAPH